MSKWPAMQIQKCLPQETLTFCIKTLILPQLDYCDAEGRNASESTQDLG